MMEVFEECKKISKNLELSNENNARNDLIKLLDYLTTNQIKYTPMINHLIRQTGLYPYMDFDTSLWEDRLIQDIFKVNTGNEEPLTLHREQSSLLKKIISGKNIAVSAPTSFGKSFVIDAFISINKPSNIMIIVPTIALTDETRRRIQKKFANQYKIITTTDVEIAGKNIFIFPQERAIHYLNKLDSLDMLVVDEFYKASSTFDKQRSPILLKAIVHLGKLAKQKYYLAPNISNLNDNPFTKDMEFLHIDFNTVVLEKHDLYRNIHNDEEKGEELLKILNNGNTKTLIYAGTYNEIDKVSDLLLDSQDIKEDLLLSFSEWLEKHYSNDWKLTDLVKKGIGIHNGQLHRSLSQIQVKLFEEDKGLRRFITTSSIIEGVNTSTETVVIWRSKNGSSNLDSFAYKNILGRSGRMFKHFIGKVYILDKPPIDEATQLTLEFPEESLADFDGEEFKEELTKEQVNKIIEYKEIMNNILGKEKYKQLLDENALQNNLQLIQDIAIDMYENPKSWNGLSYLNSDNTDKWDNSLYKIINFQPGKWGVEYKVFVKFIKVLSYNPRNSIPSLLKMLEANSITIDDFFKLERTVTFQFASLASDINILQRIILEDKGMDISSFVSKLSHAFLPSVVYQLEEYGLPRMITKKIHTSHIINFSNPELTIHKAIEVFQQIGLGKLKLSVKNLDSFDEYILDYFYDGILSK